VVANTIANANESVTAFAVEKIIELETEQSQPSEANEQACTSDPAKLSLIDTDRIKTACESSQPKMAKDRHNDCMKNVAVAKGQRARVVRLAHNFHTLSGCYILRARCHSSVRRVLNLDQIQFLTT
jgi:hypothetical protein